MAGYAILLAVCAVTLALRWGDVLSLMLEYLGAVTLWSAVWAAWCAPEKGAPRIGSVVLVNVVAHLGFMFALTAETGPEGRGCDVGSMAMFIYPGFAFVMTLLAIVLTAVGTVLVRRAREAGQRRRAGRARVVE